MDCSKVLDLLETLDDEIDDLEESLAPLLQANLSSTASKFPLIDKAKLYVLSTYAIESLLFSYLRLNGINAHEHPVFLELTRVKQYFEKIKQAEAPPAVRNLIIDKDAASRFIKAGLAGNEKHDLLNAEKLAKERARAHLKTHELQNNELQQGTTPDGFNGKLNPLNDQMPSEIVTSTAAPNEILNMPELPDKKGFAVADEAESKAVLGQSSIISGEKSKRKKSNTRKESGKSKKKRIRNKNKKLN
ncbi:putative exosome-associated family protein [Golovinomyces cichoracearum]|uniref:Exosome complex protein n=1 Tax=Golovinomyces cichoracearum TaxID=62708 RepID=A0A420IYP6_9PEZI|nr:putative exosome-associated family protein [Golovinomyces cichoracearum]